MNKSPFKVLENFHLNKSEMPMAKGLAAAEKKNQLFGVFLKIKVLCTNF